jgi:hypothetical protein
LVARIVGAYEAVERRRGTGARYKKGDGEKPDT